MTLEIILAQPRGFCAGVERAIEIVERALEIYGAPVYVRHEIVHNKYVVENLRAKGVVFVDKVEEIPTGMVAIFSAHGVSEAVEKSAESHGLKVIDATCPLVTKVHLEAMRYEKEGREIVLIGHKGHPEVEGTSGRVKTPVYLVGDVADVEALQVATPDNLAYVTQTTLSVDDTREVITALKNRFPGIKGAELKDICYATQNRQNAVRNLAAQVDLLLVIGAPNSSNSNRLRDLGEECGVKSYLINDYSEIQEAWLHDALRVGITAGASAPEILVMQVLDRLRELKKDVTVTQLYGIEESVKFKLPKEVERDVFLKETG